MSIEMNQDNYYTGIPKILTFQFDLKTIFNKILLTEHNKTQMLNYIKLHIPLTVQEIFFFNMKY